MRGQFFAEKHDFGDGRARYEEASGDHHDHLINIKNGEVIEFYNRELEAMKKQIAKDLGFELVDHRLELYATPSVSKEASDEDEESFQK